MSVRTAMISPARNTILMGRGCILGCISGTSTRRSNPLRKGHRGERAYASECVVLNTAAVVAGAVIILAGLLAVVAGYDYYVTMNEADEHLHDQLEEQGLSEIPGLDDPGDRAITGLAASVAGAITALVGGVLLVYGLLTRPKEAAPRVNPVPGATNFCESCGTQVSPNGGSCPDCGRQIGHS